MKIDNDLMLPEDALTRFQGADVTYLNLDVASRVKKRMRRYGFIIEDVGFLIQENIVCEVVVDFKLFAIPNTSTWMRGWVNVRGNLVPVYDMSGLLGFDSDIRRYNKLLIIDKGVDAIGVLVSKLPQSFNVSEWEKSSDLNDLPGTLSGFVSQSYFSNEIIWLDFNYKDYFLSIKKDIAL